MISNVYLLHVTMYSLSFITCLSYGVVWLLRNPFTQKRNIQAQLNLPKSCNKMRCVSDEHNSTKVLYCHHFKMFVSHIKHNTQKHHSKEH